ncbi:MAG: phage Gp37/Gp68 family protein [bacterium]
MPTKSRIEWTGSTWNPVTGCDRVSAGCKNCYADRMAKRLQAMGVEKYRNGFDVTLHPDVLEEPLKWKKPRMIFVNSMSDLFHKEIPFEYIAQIFSVMNRAEHHLFQILTKRPKRLVQLSHKLNWTDNIWMGVTVENDKFVSRIDDLRKTDAKIKWLSLEPLLGPIENLQLKNIDWVVVGGESGPGARPIKEEWILDIKNQCNTQKAAFFFKQWGGIHKKKAGRILRGQTYSEMPSLPSHSQLSLADFLL